EDVSAECVGAQQVLAAGRSQAGEVLGQGIERGQLLGEDRHEQPDEEDDAADDAQWSAQGLGHAQAATSESTLQEFSGPGRRTRIRGAGGGRLGAGSVGTAAHWTLTLGSTKP